MNGRVIAIDLGDRHTGWAVSDLSGLIAGEVGVINESYSEKILSRVAELADRFNVTAVVIGRPLNMNATAGERSEKSENFAEKLKELVSAEIVLWDERRTSVTANRILSDAGKKKKRQRELVDAVAASIILQGYLDFSRNRRQ